MFTIYQLAQDFFHSLCFWKSDQLIQILVGFCWHERWISVNKYYWDSKYLQIRTTTIHTTMCSHYKNNKYFNASNYSNKDWLHRHRPQIEKVSGKTRDAVLQKYLVILPIKKNMLFQRKMRLKSVHEKPWESFTTQPHSVRPVKQNNANPFTQHFSCRSNYAVVFLNVC